MPCPRCGAENAAAALECGRCGVVFARLQRAARPRPTARPAAPPPAGGAWRVVLGLAILAFGAILALRLARPAQAPAASDGRAPTADVALDDLEPPAADEAFEPPPMALAAEPETVNGFDAEAVRDLRHVRGLVSGVPTAADLEIAERLLARHEAALPGLRQHVANLYVRAARGDHDAHRSAAAVEKLTRAATLVPERVEPWTALAAVHLDAAQWTEAESAARRALELEPAQPQAQLQFAWALFRQDRNREAAAALEELLATREDPTARALLLRIRKQGRDEAGMTEQRIAAFTLRFEGDEAAEVGHEILRALERHRATLVTALDHEPQAPIPVILFSREAYYDAAGAPRWSGGVFDSIDGRIRIPIGGIDASLPPEMDETLLHEVTHAFVADLSKGTCPRDVHEGLAQYMEGKRSEEILGPEGLAALAAGRMRGVGGFYVAALAFVEHLIAERGMGGIRELLQAMGETRSVDAAFDRVHGRSADATRRAWLERLRQRYPQ